MLASYKSIDHGNYHYHIASYLYHTARGAVSGFLKILFV